MSTAYHAKYFAYELTKRCASDSMEKLAASLADAQVELNPHQVEAALFAFRSPLSNDAPHQQQPDSLPCSLIQFPAKVSGLCISTLAKSLFRTQLPTSLSCAVYLH